MTVAYGGGRLFLQCRLCRHNDVTMPSVVSIIKKEYIQTRAISLSICLSSLSLSLSLSLSHTLSVSLNPPPPHWPLKKWWGLAPPPTPQSGGGGAKAPSAPPPPAPPPLHGYILFLTPCQLYVHWFASADRGDVICSRDAEVIFMVT